jgi:hypothetical protein
MTQKFTAEEVRAYAAALSRALQDYREGRSTFVSLGQCAATAPGMLTAYADTLSKPADSGRADGMEDLLADWRRAADAHDEIGFGAAADVGRTCADDLEAALAAQGQGDDQAWDENAERLTREAGIGGGRVNPSAASMDDVFLPAPASPAGVPDGEDDAAIDRAAHVLQEVIAENDGEPSEMAHDQVRRILAAYAAPSAPAGVPDAFLVQVVKDGEAWEHRWYVPRWGDPDPSPMNGKPYCINGVEHPELGSYRVKAFVALEGKS